MRVEAEARLGAEKGKHSDERKPHFSGFRARKLNSRLGTLYLMVPKVRKGGYMPFFLTDRKRSESTLIGLVPEAFLNGVSTLKIERLARSSGLKSLSASRVSEITSGLDERVKEFWTRPLKGEYPFYGKMPYMRGSGWTVGSSPWRLWQLTVWITSDRGWRWSRCMGK